PDDGPARAITAQDGRRLWVFIPADGRHGGRPPFVPLQDVRMIMAIMAVLAGLGFSAWLARNLARPIDRLRTGFDDLAEGRLDTRIGDDVTRRADELGQLGRDFDNMAQRLGQLVESRDRLLHDVSHELRSPLARLQVAVELARQQPETTPVALDRIERESQRLDALVGQVLTIARMESGAQMVREDYVELNELLRTIADDAAFESADGTRIRITGDVHDDILIRGQGELLYRAFENIVRNAMRHTPDGTEVEVAVSRAPDAVTVRIADHGPGVPEADLRAIFEPFHRGSNSGGYGLGLAIAQRAVDAHGGRITAVNDGGLAVSILLPLNQPVPQ
ncbi:MAG: ATP-binding protein, partial [Rhodocyclaceae bacterium]